MVGLFVVADAATQVTSCRNVTYLRNRRRVGARSWKHVAANLSDLTILRRSKDFQAKRLASGVFKGSDAAIPPRVLFQAAPIESIGMLLRQVRSAAILAENWAGTSW